MALFKGAGGAIFDIDLDALSPRSREVHDEQIEAGLLEPVEDEAPVKPKRATKAAEPAADASSAPSED